MKHKKIKKQKRLIHTHIVFKDEHGDALCNALLFMLGCGDFNFQSEKICAACADTAQEKLCERDVTLTPGELKASAKAITFALSCLSEDMSKYLFMEDDFPGLLSDLKNSLPFLEEMEPHFQSMVSDLRKMQ